MKSRYKIDTTYELNPRILDNSSPRVINLIDFLFLYSSTLACLHGGFSPFVEPSKLCHGIGLQKAMGPNGPSAGREMLIREGP